MELRTLARPYAKAVFELAHSSDTSGVWAQLLGALAAAAGSPDVGRLLGSPAVGREALARLVGDVLIEAYNKQGEALEAGLQTQLRAFLRLLTQNRRLPLAPVIAEEFEALRAKSESRIDVDITMASSEVPAAQRDALEAAVAKRLQGKLTVRWDADEELIGGAVIRAGDWVLDGSLRGELERLSQNLVR